VQVDQHLQVILFRPGKRLVQLRDTADKRGTVAKDKVWDGDPDGVQSDALDGGEIPLRDVLAAVDPDAGLIDFGGELAGQVVLILRRCAVKKSGTHPFFQNQPIPQIYAFDIHDSNLPSYILRFQLSFPVLITTGFKILTVV